MSDIKDLLIENDSHLQPTHDNQSRPNEINDLAHDAEVIYSDSAHLQRPCPFNSRANSRERKEPLQFLAKRKISAPK